MEAKKKCFQAPASMMPRHNVQVQFWFNFLATQNFNLNKIKKCNSLSDLNCTQGALIGPETSAGQLA
jgi:hypothetical protein